MENKNRKEHRIRSPERIREIQMLRAGNGYFYPRQMVEELERHGVKMTRQSWSNKERGVSEFTVSELEALSEIFGMTLKKAVDFFNG